MQVSKDLVRLVAENPELPIVAYVNGDICHDYGMYWMGAFTNVFVAEVGLVGERMYDDRYDWMDAYYNEHGEDIAEQFSYSNQDPKEVRDAAEARIDEYLEKMADKYMKKCIVVYVNEPDMSEWEAA